MLKKLLWLGILLILTLVLIACDSAEEVESSPAVESESASSSETAGIIYRDPQPTETGVVIYQSDKVKVELLEPVKERVCADYERVSQTEGDAYGRNTVILRGTVSNIREARVTYWYEEFHSETTDDITMFDVTVSEVLHCRTKHYSDKQTVTVAFGYTTDSYAEGVPILEEGKEFLIFAYAPEDRENSSMELEGYTDLWCRSAHYLMLEKVGDSYLTTNFFEPASEGKSLAQALNVTESDVKYFAQLLVGGERMQEFFEQHGNADGSKADAYAALIALKTYMKPRSRETLWSLAHDYYAIKADALEAYILSVIERRND